MIHHPQPYGLSPGPLAVGRCPTSIDTEVLAGSADTDLTHAVALGADPVLAADGLAVAQADHDMAAPAVLGSGEEEHHGTSRCIVVVVPHLATQSHGSKVRAGVQVAAPGSAVCVGYKSVAETQVGGRTLLALGPLDGLLFARFGRLRLGGLGRVGR